MTNYRIIENAGARAFCKGLKYHENPHSDPARRLAWSRGFNNARVNFLVYRDRMRLTPV